MEKSLVSVLIITWNRKDEVIKTIQDVYDQAYQNIEIILVDNGSTDGTIKAVQVLFPEVRIVPLERNLGVVARNAGIAIARGDIVFCLDSDASPARDCIINIVRKFQAEPKIAVINSKIVNAHTKQIDNIAGWSYSEVDKQDQNREFLSFTFSEGGAAIRKELFERIGPFWEPLFFGGEGLEFSLRVLDSGCDILYYPGAVVYHRAVSQSRVSGGQRDYLFFKNLLFIYFVRFPWWLMAIFMPIKIGATLFRAFKRGYPMRIVQGFYEFLCQIPYLIKQRHPIQNKTAYKFLRLQRQHGSLRWNLVTWLKYKTS